MITPQDPIKKISASVKNSATLKIVSIGILVLALLIPTMMINSLINEPLAKVQASVFFAFNILK